MTLADARVLAPDLQVGDADPDADAAFLERMAERHRRYTPSLATSPPDGLDLDVTGASALFGGEDGLTRDLCVRLDQLGVAARLGLADTPGLAYALARFAAPRPSLEGPGASLAVAPPGERAGVLRDMPVEALRLESDSLAVLRRLGLRRVGQLLDMPRASLARRFGAVLLQRLDEALGLRAHPLRLRLEPSQVFAERRLASPVITQDAVLNVLRLLAESVAGALEQRGCGARGFDLDLFRMDGAVRRVAVAASAPLRSAQRVTALFTERLSGLDEGLEADFGFDVLRLTARRTEVLVARTPGLTQGVDRAGAFADLVDRIAARDGLHLVRLAPRDAHRPAPSPTVRVDQVSRADVAAAWAQEPPLRFEGAPLRPLRLFAPPQPIEEVVAEVPEGPPARFRWRRLWRRVSRAEGPERFAPDFDLEPDPEFDPDPPAQTRDYYRLEDEDGRRYWVFRQGLYGAARPAAWFLHGLFG